MNDPTLLQACRLLFGEDVVISEHFLDYLQPGGLKSAYRQRVRETHPDSQPLPAVNGLEAFFAVQQAYQLLAAYLQERDHGQEPSAAPMDSRPGKPSPAPKTAQSEQWPPSLQTIGPIILESPFRSGSSTASIDRLYRGPLPERPLLFGHFLYYCGLTTWRTITSVLVRQQRDRPRCGELGTRFGMLQPKDIARILGAKSPQQPFGQVAVSLGLLSEQQLHTLLRHQQRQQKKFGTILVEQQLITPEELSYLLNLFAHHNSTNRRRS